MAISISTISDYRKKIGQVKIVDKSVLYELRESQRNQCFEMWSMLFLMNSNDQMFDRIVTGDEKWIFYDNCKRLALWLDQDKTLKHFPNSKLQE